MCSGHKRWSSMHRCKQLWARCFVREGFLVKWPHGKQGSSYDAGDALELAAACFHRSQFCSLLVMIATLNIEIHQGGWASAKFGSVFLWRSGRRARCSGCPKRKNKSYVGLRIWLMKMSLPLGTKTTLGAVRQVPLVAMTAQRGAVEPLNREIRLPITYELN
jgi:hypothetical protein